MKKIPAFLLAMITIFLLALLHLYIYTKNIGLDYEVKQLKVKLGKLYDDERNLKSIVSGKRSLSRIDNLASKELGLVYPEKMTYVHGVKKGK